MALEHDLVEIYSRTWERTIPMCRSCFESVPPTLLAEALGIVATPPEVSKQ